MADDTTTGSAPVRSVVARIRAADVMHSVRFYRHLGFELGNVVRRECPPFHWAWFYQANAPNEKTGANRMLVSGEVAETTESKAKTVLFYLSLCAGPEIAPRGAASEGLQRKRYLLSRIPAGR